MKTILRITSITTIAMMLLGLTPAIATAQTSVQGHGKVLNDEPFSDAEISVNAWLDANGVAHGTAVWVGGTTPRRPGGPANPTRSPCSAARLSPSLPATSSCANWSVRDVA
jgi:hypothetical protein